MIEVQGTPVGKGRPRFTRDGHAYTPDTTRDFEARIKWKAKTVEKRGKQRLKKIASVEVVERLQQQSQPAAVVKKKPTKPVVVID